MPSRIWSTRRLMLSISEFTFWTSVFVLSMDADSSSVAAMLSEVSSARDWAESRILSAFSLSEREQSLRMSDIDCREWISPSVASAMQPSSSPLWICFWITALSAILNCCSATILSSMAPSGFMSPLMITLETTSRTTSAAAPINIIMRFSLSVVAKISSDLSDTIKSQPRFAI